MNTSENLARFLGWPSRAPFGWRQALWIFAFFVIVGGLACPAAASEPMPLGDLLARIQEAYDKTADLSAGFVQETRVSAVSRATREEGVVSIKKPNKMLWDYSRPKVKRLIINAEKAWLYVPQDNAVYVQSADKIFKSQLLVRFLSGLGKLREDFDIAYAAEPRDAKGNFRLNLKAKSAELGLRSLQISVEPVGYQILACRFTDAVGNTTSVQFRNIRTNRSLPDKMFRFRPPKGTDVYPL